MSIIAKISLMTKMDCAQNSELVKELEEFLQENGSSISNENELLLTNDNISKSLLESFLKKTNRTKHKIMLIEPDSFLIAISVKMEDIGLESCEFCGYTGHKDLVQVHRRSHQAL